MTDKESEEQKGALDCNLIRYIKFYSLFKQKIH